MGARVRKQASARSRAVPQRGGGHGNASAIAGIVLALALSTVLTASKIDLTTADLGRHLQNGHTWLAGSNRWAVLNTNYYSYTNPGFPFVNHHWASGVLFYLVWRVAGFDGLSIFYLALSLLTFLIFFRLAQQAGGTLLALAVAFLVLPIITIRKEIRPEVFTYFFCGLFYWILWKYTSPPLQEGRDVSHGKTLLLLPVTMCLWVNLHIGFIVGIGILGIFWLNELLKFVRRMPNRLRFLTAISALTVLATLLNPSGLRGALYPLSIFNNYGYLVEENRSVWDFQRAHGTTSYIALFEIALVLVIVSFLGVFRKDRKRCSFVNLLLIAMFGCLAAGAVRDFPLFGLFALPVLATNLRIVLPERNVYTNVALGAAAVMLFAVALRGASPFIGQNDLPWIGLLPGAENAAEFLKANNIGGPVFNDYDIGSYLIYELYPQQKVFVDNRPEAYPRSFLEEGYVRMQEDESVWKEQENKYKFNTIVFSSRDLTTWGQRFLVSRLQDPSWAVVYADQYAFIFLKRNSSNNSLIQKYEIPKNRFGIVNRS